MFKEFSYIFTLILVHELGHLQTAKILKWNIEKLVIYPFGGCVKLNEKLTKPIKEEMLILINGPLIQVLFFLSLYYLSQKGLLISQRNIEILKTYNYTLLIFNLLPIYPLDGGKILNLILNKLMPYKKSNKLTIIISILIIIFALFLYKSLNFILMAILILTEIIVYLKNQDYLYNKLLLERYINPQKYKKLKIIKNKNLMYKEKRHIIKHNNKYITEKEYLNKRFQVIKWKNLSY